MVYSVPDTMTLLRDLTPVRESGALTAFEVAVQALAAHVDRGELAPDDLVRLLVTVAEFRASTYGMSGQDFAAIASETLDSGMVYAPALTAAEH